jgi:hypothetical protein
MTAASGPSQNHRAARLYAEQGIAVFPLRSKTKVPYAGSHGELDGTTDAATIDRTWQQVPNALVAAALRFTPYFVVDVDGRHDGDNQLGALEVEHGKLPHTVTAISGSGWPSVHLWFKRTAELEEVRVCALSNRADLTSDVDLKNGVDLKGLRAGYVVLPPSLHPSGRRYEWEASSRFGEVAIAAPPTWFIRRIKAKSTKFTTTTAHETDVEPESFYLGKLFKSAGRLGRQIRPGVFAVRCPNEGSHSQGRPFDGSSVIFAPQKSGGRGTFFCSHTSGCSEVFR